MFDKSIMRRVEVRRGHNDWEVCDDIGRLMPGDIFCMFEPNGDTVFDAAGFSSWVVEATPHVPCKPYIPEAHSMSPLQNGGR